MIPASVDFLNAMKRPIKQVYVKVELLDSVNKFIKEITQKVTRESVGSISVDSNRDIRRSFSLQLLNNNKEFLWGSDKDIWLDKRIKLYIGLKTPSGNVDYVPQGVFCVSDPSDSHTFEGNFANITGQDKAFLYTSNRGKFLNETKIETGAKIIDAIKLIAKGETLFNFDNITKTVPYELTYQANESRWNAMKELAELAQCEIYYDVNGYLRLKEIDLNQIANYSPVWSFKYGDPTEKFYAGNTRTLDDSETYNHFITLGGSSQTAIARHELKVTNTDSKWADSPYAIERIGDLIYFHNNANPDSLLTTDEECIWRNKYSAMKYLGFTEKISMQIAPLYLLESSDFIQIQDETNEVDGVYYINSIQIPLSPTLMTIEAQKRVKVLDDWNFM